MATRYMMATKATHITGDLSRDTPDLCYVFNEDGEEYIGRWATGFGFVEVHFPKDSTRDLTDEETAHYRGRHIVLSGMDLGPAID